MTRLFSAGKVTALLLAAVGGFIGWLKNDSLSERPSFSCEVVGIADGDTFSCLSGKQSTTVRLFGIDAPEKKQAYGKAAKQYLSSRIYRKTVTVTSHGLDRYGRTLGLVMVDGQAVNREMVAAGYAWVYRQYTDDADLLRAEETARTAKAGLWADPHPIKPTDFRHR